MITVEARFVLFGIRKLDLCKSNLNYSLLKNLGSIIEKAGNTIKRLRTVRRLAIRCSRTGYRLRLALRNRRQPRSRALGCSRLFYYNTLCTELQLYRIELWIFL